MSWWRLGAAAADTKRTAGYFRSIPHDTFSGVTAAVAPNRSLYAVFIYLSLSNLHFNWIQGHPAFLPSFALIVLVILKIVSGSKYFFE